MSIFIPPKAMTTWKKLQLRKKIDCEVFRLEKIIILVDSELKDFLNNFAIHKFLFFLFHSLAN